MESILKAGRVEDSGFTPGGLGKFFTLLCVGNMGSNKKADDAAVKTAGTSPRGKNYRRSTVCCKSAIIPHVVRRQERCIRVKRATTGSSG